MDDKNQVLKLIDHLKKLKENNSSLLSCISDYFLLISSLQELNSMVEMESVKSSIVSQIKFLMVNNSLEDNNFDDHMLHTVLCGPPGCGKSKMGVILAKIWTALGLLEKDKKRKKRKTGEMPYDSKEDSDSDTEDEELEKQIHILTKTGKIKSEVVKKLQDYIEDIKVNLKELDTKLLNYNVKTLKRELEKKSNLSYIKCLKLVDDIIEQQATIGYTINTVINTQIPEENVKFSLPIPLKEIKIIDKIIKDIKRIPLKESGIFSPDKNGFIPHAKIVNEVNLEPKDFDLIRIVSREDFIGGYLGQTAIKTEKLLKDSIGKVLFIDEAYSLVNDEKDSYGYECLTTLNRFMSEHSSEIVIIFAGYKDLMEKTIFKAQPGLKRRCTWHFEIEGYSETGLSKIFETQLKNNGWLISPDVDLLSFFKENLKDFPYFGGDTLRLVFYCKICYSNLVFDENYKNTKVINQEILDNALEYLRVYRIQEKEEEFISHCSMYM